jgi:hypothetical protein
MTQVGHLPDRSRSTREPVVAHHVLERRAADLALQAAEHGLEVAPKPTRCDVVGSTTPQLLVVE